MGAKCSQGLLGVGLAYWLFFVARAVWAAVANTWRMPREEGTEISLDA